MDERAAALIGQQLAAPAKPEVMVTIRTPEGDKVVPVDLGIFILLDALVTEVKGLREDVVAQQAVADARS